MRVVTIELSDELVEELVQINYRQHVRWNEGLSTLRMYGDVQFLANLFLSDLTEALKDRNQTIRTSGGCEHLSTRLSLTENKQTCNICGASWPIIDDETRQRMDANRKGGTE